MQAAALCVIGALLAVLDGFIARMDEFRQALAGGDSASIKRFIAEGTAAKQEELSRRQISVRRGDEPYRG